MEISKQKEKTMETQEIKEFTCNKCGRVHFGVTLNYAKNEVETFNKYYDTLTPEKREQYYGSNPSTLKQYECCSFCGNHFSNFRPSLVNDAPAGVTLGPIIYIEKE